MKYIVVNSTPGREGIAFLKSGRTGFPCENNPPRLYEAAIDAQNHARLLRSMFGGEWHAEDYDARQN